MSKSLSHSSKDRAVDQFLRLSRLARDLGITHQSIEDDEFRSGHITLDGRDVVNFGLCCYLGLGDDPRLVDGAIDAIKRYGNSYSSSIAYTALPMYHDLSDRLSAMLDAPVAIAGTTTLAHLAALPVIVRPGEDVLIDEYAHASMRSVMPTLQVTGSEVRKVAHNDLETVADLATSAKGRVWYVIDGLYSMHGDTAPAEDIAALLASTPNLWVYCDDAHGLGWDGIHGRGQFLRRAGWHERLVMSFGLAKSFGTMGGVVAAKDPDLIEAVTMNGGPLVFGGPLPPAVLGASIVSADIHLSDELVELQDDLAKRMTFVNEFSEAAGLPMTSREQTPLWYVEVGHTMTTGSVVIAMLHEGFYLNTAVFPVVPRGRSGLRFTVTRYNTLDEIESMLTTLKAAIAQYGDGTEDVIDLTRLEDREGVTGAD